MNIRIDPLLLNSPARGRTWLQRSLLAVLGLTVFVLGFFFIAVVLIVGTLVAIALALRWWWIVRRLRAARKAAAPLEGEYVVIDAPRITER